MFTLLLICGCGFNFDYNSSREASFGEKETLAFDFKSKVNTEVELGCASGMLGENATAADYVTQVKSVKSVKSSHGNSTGPVRKMVKRGPVRKILGCFGGKLRGLRGGCR